MNNSTEANKLFNEDITLKDNCNLCKESSYKVGQKIGYGVVICKIGDSNNGWFATLSPRTGGNPKLDFTIQLMPFSHLTHFSQISSHEGLAENYGILFSKVCRAMTKIMMQNEDLRFSSEKRSSSLSIATYGKCTTWTEKKEHLHIKIFPFRGDIGQPYTVDSSFGRKEVFKDSGAGQEFVKMVPVKKVAIGSKRFEQLGKKLVSLSKK